MILRHLAGILFHLGGLFVLPFVVGFVTALFFEVGEVAETLPVLLAVGLLVIVPAFVAQALGVVLKTRREWRMLRDQGRLTLESGLAALHRHARILTPRGWALLVTGLWFVVCALSLKWASLSVVATFALLLFYAVLGASAFLSTFLVGTFQAALGRRASVVRGMSPAVVLAGEAAEERFILTRVPVPPGYHLLIEDELPARLQTVSRYALGAGARTEAVVAGRLRATPRGLYQLGPAEVYYQDVLGLTRVALASVATAELKVLPRFRDLEIRDPPRSRVEAPDAVARPHRFPTEDHFRFREYVAGDDTRRIAWKLSMRTGRLQLRQPENRETTNRTVLLALDAWLPRGWGLADAVGIEEVLDRLVETWISLAKELVERGDRVTLVGAMRQPDGAVAVEVCPARRGGHMRWQDLGARAVWQGAFDIPALLDAAGDASHGVVVSSRFAAPPPQPFPGQSLTWVWLPPQDALGPRDPPLLEVLAGGSPHALTWLVRHPFVAGADENGFFAQVRHVAYHLRRLDARARVRSMARSHGDRTLQALLGRGDAVYRLEPGATCHRLVGLSAGKGA